MTAAELQELEELIKEKEVKAAINDFWLFCKLLAPDFYLDSRPHLKELCNALQYIYEGKPLLDGRVYKNIMINMPPQFGKTRTMSMWCRWVLGKSRRERFILGSYSDTPATDMSRAIRDGISEEKNLKTDLVYSDIFPETKLKYGDSGVKRWALEGEHFNFLAAGIIGGGVTGKGATIQIFDDLIKGREEALNKEHKDKVWGSYSSTWGSRKDSSVQEPIKVMISTRWSDDDPCGRELNLNKDDWYVFKMQAYNEDTKEMLCSDFLNYETYHKKLRTSKENTIEEGIFLANYQQETIDKRTLLYSDFKEYDEIPFGKVKNQTDTADTGDDYLCSINYIEDNMGYKYVIDIVYTQSPMEITEPLVAKMLIKDNVQISRIESNNGGRGFARKINEITPSNIKIDWYHESGNKESRIFSNSLTVNQMILFPRGWKNIFPLFYKHLSEYKSNFKANKHDDIPDVLTSMIEIKKNRLRATTV